MQAALALVRGHLGSHAVILHTRTYRRGGVFGIGAKQVVEVTAADGREVGRHRRTSHEARRKQLLAEAARRRTGAPHHAPGSPADRPEPPAGDLIKRTYAAARAEMATAPVGGSAACGLAPPPPAPVAVSATPQPAHANAEQLTDEMRAVRRLVEAMIRKQRQGGGPSAEMPRDKLFEQYLGLVEQQVAEELAEEAVERARSTVDANQLLDAAPCRDAVRRVLAEWLPIDDRAGTCEPPADGRPRTIALVGPTGVGKTTTIAKLAATFKLKHDKRVALITLDTYRIAAVDQLRTYAGIIGVPLHVVNGPAELNDAVARCDGYDVVLIDTAGRSQRNSDRLDELAACLDAAKPHEAHLVLSATCCERVLMETVERFGKVPTDRIIFTKLDEAVSFGSLLNVAKRVNKKLSYLTTGQEVPHQIEPTRADRLAGLMLGELIGADEA